MSTLVEKVMTFGSAMNILFWFVVVVGLIVFFIVDLSRRH